MLPLSPGVLLRLLICAMKEWKWQTAQSVLVSMGTHIANIDQQSIRSGSAPSRDELKLNFSVKSSGFLGSDVDPSLQFESRPAAHTTLSNISPWLLKVLTAAGIIFLKCVFTAAPIFEKAFRSGSKI